jgi:hypothetical protein
VNKVAHKDNSPKRKDAFLSSFTTGGNQAITRKLDRRFLLVNGMMLGTHALACYAVVQSKVSVCAAPFFLVMMEAGTFLLLGSQPCGNPIVWMPAF